VAAARKRPPRSAASREVLVDERDAGTEPRMRKGKRLCNAGAWATLLPRRNDV